MEEKATSTHTTGLIYGLNDRPPVREAIFAANGAIITVVPLLVTGFMGRYFWKLNYYTLIGVLSGANTNPPALAYSSDLTSCDAPAVGYATVYPLAMFLRVLTAQLLILALA